MSDSVLSFASSSSFRNTLIARNLAPYQVQGVYTSPAGNVTYEATPLNDSNVIDSPDTLISTNQGANTLYSLNEYGPDGGFNGKYSVPAQPYPVEPNQGPYDINDSDIDLINEFYIDASYVKNIYGPSGGYKDMVIITDLNLNNSIQQPYFTFVPSFYSPYDILFSSDPLGSDGSLSQDSYIAKLGAVSLKGYFNERIAEEIKQLTIGSINLDTLSDPFSASLLATGQQPLFIKNWKITVPEFPPAAAVSFANRLTGTYFPVSFIPGDYFEENDPLNNVNPVLNTVNNLTGGFLGPILNKQRNPSEIFLANTGNGQQSILFASLDYNLYRPTYRKNLIQSASSAINNLFGGGSNSTGGYYVGSDTAEPSLINSPANEVAIDRFGKQQATIVYGPDELGKLYEGNESKINFGLKAVSYTDAGGIDGRFVWTSPKYKDNAGFKVGKGGENIRIDDEFNQIQSQYEQNQSTGIEFRGGSILDNTQRIIQAADNVQGQRRLKHVGNAMNQVSKVFNDGYKEMTKGSQVIAYYDQSSGSNTIGVSGVEVGREYCRVFQKDTPYYTYADLQKTDGITTAGRKFNNSVLDNTYNLNIAPLRGIGSTNIVDGKVKKYMFSLENLAWRTSDQPGFRYDDLPTCEKGPNGGRIMWFPPYDLTFSEDSKAGWNPTSFLGRPEPLYTYKNTTRSGSINWKIVVDTPAAMNTIIERQLANKSPQEVNSIMDSFFAGCVKYDIYDLAVKFNNIPTSELYNYQQMLNDPRLTEEEYNNIIGQIPVDESANGGNNGKGNTDDAQNVKNDVKVTTESTIDVNDRFNQFKGYAFYFENDIPSGNPNTTASDSFDTYYTEYLNLKGSKYVNMAPAKVFVKNSSSSTEGQTYTKEAVQTFFNDVIESNFNELKTELLKRIDETIIENNGKVTITLEGSASSPQTQGYNDLLSQRRIDSVKKWFAKQTFSNGESYKVYIDNKRLSFTEIPRGEDIIIAKTTNGQGQQVNCTVEPQLNDIKGLVTSESKWYSVPAMVCRRVAITDIIAEQVVTFESPTDIVNQNTDDRAINDSKGDGTNVIPQPKPYTPPNPIQKIKDGISKKILRSLFSECDYFDVIKQTNPMVYDTFKEKIKYFSPAFHSTTPEGLNSRLTFLNQCLRPGQTIPVIGPDGKPKYNDALNTSFGTPPVLVLRIGDFYHTKIIPNSLSISYDPLLFDINPEGIGVQPMIAKIQLSFDFIGGEGLAGPIEQLQNALSFNFYGNTEIYDERSVSTESTKERDENIVGKLVKDSGVTFQPIQSNEIQNQISNRGGSTIGSILSTTAQDGGKYETGEIEYVKAVKELSDNTNQYFKIVYNKMRSILDTSNNGIVQLTNFKRDYDNGQFSQYELPVDNVPIYGKPKNVEKRVQSLIKAASKDVNQDENPIVKNIKGNQSLNNSSAAIRDLKAKLLESISPRETEINELIVTPINDLVAFQENYNYVFRKFDLLSTNVDGIKIENGDYKVYTLNPSGTTEENGVLTDLYDVYIKNVGLSLQDYGILINKKNIVNESYDDNNDVFIDTNSKITTDEDKRFYMVMSSILLDEPKYNSFVDSLITQKIKDTAGMESAIRTACSEFKKLSKEQHDYEVANFKEFEESSEYKKYTTFKIDEFNAKVSYSTDNIGNNIQKKKRIKDLYSNINLNNKEKTYNNKVQFN